MSGARPPQRTRNGRFDRIPYKISCTLRYKKKPTQTPPQHCGVVIGSFQNALCLTPFDVGQAQDKVTADVGNLVSSLAGEDSSGNAPEKGDDISGMENTRGTPGFGNGISEYDDRVIGTIGVSFEPRATLSTSSTTEEALQKMQAFAVVHDGIDGLREPPNSNEPDSEVQM